MQQNRPGRSLWGLEGADVGSFSQTHEAVGSWKAATPSLVTGNPGQSHLVHSLYPSALGILAFSVLALSAY